MHKLTLLLALPVALVQVPDLPNLAPGKTIPAFEAPDQTGARRTFDSVRGPKGAVLLFYRSADW